MVNNFWQGGESGQKEGKEDKLREPPYRRLGFDFALSHIIQCASIYRLDFLVTLVDDQRLGHENETVLPRWRAFRKRAFKAGKKQ